MSSLSRLRQRLVLFGCLSALPALAWGQTAFAPEAEEYAVAGTLVGDQTYPSISINLAGGYVAWQDNSTDESGLGISARRLNSTLSGSFAPFRVNKVSTGDQDSPKVAMLRDGNALIVWRSGQTNIHARIIKADGTFAANNDIVVNSFPRSLKTTPAVAALSDGSAMVVWSSQGQDGSMQGIFGQRLSATGEKISAEFQLNESTLLNQRTPSVAGLPNGSSIVVWISESQANGSVQADVYARVIPPTGPIRTHPEFKVNDSTTLAANPVIAVAGNGAFLVSWSQRTRPSVSRKSTSGADPTGVYVEADTSLDTNSWDVVSRAFSGEATPKSASIRVNTYKYGQQFAPQIAVVQDDYLLVWTSVAQDGSDEGVYGQFLNIDGVPILGELRVNSTTRSKQIHPAIGGDGQGRFLAVWSSFVGGAGSFDLFAQRFSATRVALQVPPPAYASALSSSRLGVAWPQMDGYDVDHYELFVDNSTTAISVTNNFYVLSRLVPASSHSFQWRYVVAGGQISPMSSISTGLTWDEDLNGDSLPDDWQARFWGSDRAKWPSADADTDRDGASNLQEFLAGTDPGNSASMLRTSVSRSNQGTRLNWNTVAGSIYQAQVSSDLRSWNNLGSPRFAVGTTDSILLQQFDPKKSYYRLIRLR